MLHQRTRFKYFRRKRNLSFHVHRRISEKVKLWEDRLCYIIELFFLDDICSIVNVTGGTAGPDRLTRPVYIIYLLYITYIT